MICGALNQVKFKPVIWTRTFKMSTITYYNVIFVGSGQAGTPLASAFAKTGKKTALIEKSHIGGCCVNEGCTQQRQ
jgi:ribulose 1,5-bisphosphate synthetase/thiazole synthase